MICHASTAPRGSGDDGVHVVAEPQKVDAGGRPYCRRLRFQGRPLAGVFLLTDGNATDIKNSLPDLTGVPPVEAMELLLNKLKKTPNNIMFLLGMNAS